ncbi:MAG: carboxypeptidase-like regulatory domain-containing protein [Oligoflexia bacterium]|nr:carboxypeptidase-like regulatory domain-containing protein [Oligoflexia bacterium]
MEKTSSFSFAQFGAASARSLGLAASALTLFAGSFFLISSGYSLFQNLRGTPTTIDTQSFTWLKDVRLDVEKSRLPSDAELLVGPPLPPAGWVAKASSVSPKSPAPLPPKPHRHVRRVIAQGAKPQKLKQTIVTSQAASIAVAAAPVASPESKLQDEVAMMQALHAGLRQRFMVAMSTLNVTTQVAVATATPPAQSQNPEPESVNNHWHPLRRHKPAAKAQKSVAQEIAQDVAESSKKAEPQPTIQTMHERYLAFLAAQRAQDQIISRPQQQAPDSMTLTQAAPAPEAAPMKEPDSEVTADNDDEGPSIEEKTGPEAAAVMPPTEELNPSLQKDAARLWSEYSVQEAQHITTSAGIIVSTQNSSRIVTTQGPAVKIQSPVVSNQPVTAAASNSLPSVSVPPVSVIASNSLPFSADARSALRAPAVTPVVSKTRTMIEAFEWSTPVSGASFVRFTNEGPSSTHEFAGWGKAEAPDHWPTLARSSVAGVPLISRNSAKLLSAIAGVTLQGDTGIVFGKIPSGWNVRISGRAERPVVLNYQNQTVAPQSSDGDRYFAFLNVTPGAHLVYLADASGAEQGAVAAAVLDGTSSYFDLTSISHATASGQVLDGSGETIHPQLRVTVRILGKATAVAQTDDHGRFQIPNVTTVGDYPVFIETDAAEGHTHRYQVKAQQLSSLTLYRLDSRAIEDWLNQLEGSISPESGLIVAALPSLVASFGSTAHLQPEVQTLGSTEATLQPEVYTLDSTGQLEVHVPLDEQANRFISVQIPEGPALASLVDSSGQVVWSQIVVSSPGVVSLIGPN